MFAAMTQLLANTPQGDSEKSPKVGTTRTFYDTPNNGNVVRKSIGNAVKKLEGLGGVKNVAVDASLDFNAAAVAANLALTISHSPPSPFNPNEMDSLPQKLKFTPTGPLVGWNKGVIYAQAQNLARTLNERPANMMTPTSFVERARKEFDGIPNVEIPHKEEWTKSKNTHLFLSVTQGTSELAKFLEIHYEGSADPTAQHLVPVGNFDSGRISLKPGAGMKLMRGDMGGAAAVISAVWAVAKLQMPIYTMKGKSIEVSNTDAEGCLILSYKLHSLIDVATLTGAMVIAGIFSTSDELWDRLHAAGEAEYDRFWRISLDDDFATQITSSKADLQNSCFLLGRLAGSITAPVFLKAFAEGAEAKDSQEPAMKWAHIDTAGSMEISGERMTGRPVRALVDYVSSLANA
ncbi:hypothetical protein K443DRAFT_135453 [Laccaria amethystina LaAM-08-1]|uniref:Cytosol aminopeptidase domain-containing protein n=1 Tax=Laccaria amethystina LaAM-08-1 TaxID=1095629 RepID=A0A0C9X5A4_9AGAR|nr:hypothetical protein K443DRAFT_135453 [Laccaria amethystina LaAM-08-1]